MHTNPTCVNTGTIMAIDVGRHKPATLVYRSDLAAASFTNCSLTQPCTTATRAAPRFYFALALEPGTCE